MTFYYKQDKNAAIGIMKSKAEKKNLNIKIVGDKIELSLKSGEFQRGEDALPITFHGKIINKNNGCSLTGRFAYGFYLYTMVIVAALLVVARFAWSVFQNHTGNMILCGIAAVLLLVIVLIVHTRTKPARSIIEEFLNWGNLTE